MAIEYNLTSERAIVRMEFWTVGDGEEPKIITFPVVVGSDGRFFYGVRFKPTVNGQWPLRVKAFDVIGRFASVLCTPGITVTF